MNIIPWKRRESPLSSAFDLDEIWGRFFEPGENGFRSHLPELFRTTPMPPVNIAETEDGYTITMDCPGLEEDDFEVQAMGQQLVISGERRWEDEKKGKEFRRVESQYGKFERVVQLPENARTDSKEIHATYKKGILTVRVPKVEKTPAARIPIQFG